MTNDEITKDIVVAWLQQKATYVTAEKTAEAYKIIFKAVSDPYSADEKED